MMSNQLITDQTGHAPDETGSRRYEQLLKQQLAGDQTSRMVLKSIMRRW